MVKITLHSPQGTYVQEVPVQSNLVVLAGLKKFPGLRYSCGIGRCGKCASRVLTGGEHLPPPNWKEERVLGAERLAEGYRLLCQINVVADLEVEQDPVPITPAWRQVNPRV